MNAMTIGAVVHRKPRPVPEFFGNHALNIVENVKAGQLVVVNKFIITNVVGDINADAPVAEYQPRLT